MSKPEELTRSETQAIVQRSLPGAQSIAGERGRMGWLETECPEAHGISNQGCLPLCKKEGGRSQSPHSNGEAGNDRGVKEDRKVEA